jgi:hypothetical protein
VIAGICLLLVIIISKLLTAPVQGHKIAVDHAIKQSQSTTPKPVPASILQNQYFRLQLPIGYSPQTNTAPLPTGILLTQTILKTSTNGTEIITVSVTGLPTGGLANNSSYQLRVQSPQIYKITTQTIAGDTLSLSKRIDGQSGEVVAFWPHGAWLATVSLTTGLDDNSSDSQQTANLTDLQTLLANWQWQ